MLRPDGRRGERESWSSGEGKDVPRNEAVSGISMGGNEGILGKFTRLLKDMTGDMVSA